MRGVDKIFMPLAGVPVIARALSAFQACGYIDEIIIVTSEDSLLPMWDVCREYGIAKATKILPGGQTRTRSVYNGLKAAPPEAEYAAVHDGARPLVTPELIARVTVRAYDGVAAVPVAALRDTVKKLDGELVESTVNRDTLASVQTPQVFKLPLIRDALARAVSGNRELTDESSALEGTGVQILTVPGSYDNLKITVPEDIYMAEALLGGRARM